MGVRATARYGPYPRQAVKREDCQFSPLLDTRPPRGCFTPEPIQPASGLSKSREILLEFQSTDAAAPLARCGASGRTRTCDRPLRRRLLCPLSYGGVRAERTEARKVGGGSTPGSVYDFALAWWP